MGRRWAHWLVVKNSWEGRGDAMKSQLQGVQIRRELSMLTSVSEFWEQCLSSAPFSHDTDASRSRWRTAGLLAAATLLMLWLVPQRLVPLCLAMAERI